MTPPVDRDAAWVGVERAEQGLERVIGADREGGGAEHLEVLGDKPHPGLFPCRDQDDGAQQECCIAVQCKEARQLSFWQGHETDWMRRLHSAKSAS